MDVSLGWITYGILIGLVGIVFLFFGLRYYRAILFILGFGVSFFTIQEGLLWILSSCGVSKLSMQDYAFFVDWIVPGVGGLIAGFLLVQGWKVGIYLLGGIGGFVSGMFLMSALMPFDLFREWMFESGEQLSLLYKSMWLGGFSILGVFLVRFFERGLVMVSTSLIGAGCMCAAVDAFADTRFHSFVQKVAQFSYVQHPEALLQQLREPAYLGNIVAMSILTVVGILVQLRMSGLLRSMLKRRGQDSESLKSLV